MLPQSTEGATDCLRSCPSGWCPELGSCGRDLELCHEPHCEKPRSCKDSSIVSCASCAFGDLPTKWAGGRWPITLKLGSTSEFGGQR